MNIAPAGANPHDILQLQCSDGIVSATRAAACKSRVIQNMLEDIKVAQTTNTIIPVLSGSSATLTSVMAWCERNKHVPNPPDQTYLESLQSKEDISKEISRVDKTWIERFDQEQLFHIIVMANYLDVKGLLNVGCKTVADMIKGQDVEAIRRIYNIRADFTLAEQEQIRAETDWATRPNNA